MFIFVLIKFVISQNATKTTLKVGHELKTVVWESGARSSQFWDGKEYVRYR